MQMDWADGSTLMTFHLLRSSTVNYVMSQQKLETSLQTSSLRMHSHRSVPGNAGSVMQSMDKDRLAAILMGIVMALCFAMGYLVNGQ